MLGLDAFGDGGQADSGGTLWRARIRETVRPGTPVQRGELVASDPQPGPEASTRRSTRARVRPGLVRVRLERSIRPASTSARYRASQTVDTLA